jgi:uncharacterized membrane protein
MEQDNKETKKETPVANQTTENKQNSDQVDNDKVWAIVAYFIFFLPLIFVKERSAFLKFHINQGLNLFIVALVGNIILSMPMNYFMIMLSQLWGLLTLILAIIGIVNVTKKEMKHLPIIGNLFNIIK